MDAGRELNILVAEKVLGWVRKGGGPGVIYFEWNGWTDELPHFSTDIAAAWPLTEVIRKRWPECLFQPEEKGEGWTWRSDPNDIANNYYGAPFSELTITRPTLQHVLCLAALAAVGVSV